MSALTLIFIITQLVTLAFIGGFARTTTVQVSFTLVGSNILFYLCWSLLYAPFKKLTLHSLFLLLISIAIGFECNLMFGRFWYNTFHEFTTIYELTTEIMIESSLAIFPILIVMIDFIGIWKYWQFYVFLVPIINLGWSLNYAILRYGITIFDGGLGLNVFLFSGVLTIVIWVVSIRGRHNRYEIENNALFMKKETYYNGYTISIFFGLIGLFILWPYFNTSCSILSSELSILQTSLTNNIIFQNTAFTNTILSLSIGFLTSFFLINRDGTKENKIPIELSIQSFINSGIVIASFMDIAINPAASMVIALISSVITVIISTKIKNESPSTPTEQLFVAVLRNFTPALWRIFLPFVSIIITSIVIVTRQNSSVLLLNTDLYGTSIYSKTAGLEFAGFFITLGIATVFGIFCGFAINAAHSLIERLDEEEQTKIKQKENQQKGSLKKTSLQKNSSLQSPPEKKRKENESSMIRPVLITHNDPISDMTFFTDITEESFPLFLSPNDRPIDEEETARKLLKEAILSHVKSNVKPHTNYNSVTKNLAFNTSDTNYPGHFSNHKKDEGQKEKYESGGKIENRYASSYAIKEINTGAKTVKREAYDLEKDVTLKNEVKKSKIHQTPINESENESVIQINTNVNSPESISSFKNEFREPEKAQEKNKPIENNKQASENSAFESKKEIKSREPMPKFYIDRIEKVGGNSKIENSNEEDLRIRAQAEKQAHVVNSRVSETQPEESKVNRKLNFEVERKNSNHSIIMSENQHESSRKEDKDSPTLDKQ